MLLLSVPLAFPCSPRGGISLRHGADLPLDASAATWGASVSTLSLRDAEGSEVPVESAATCYDGDSNVSGGCATRFAPTAGWTAGGTWEVTVTYSEYLETFEQTWPITAATDGRVVTPVSGRPDLSVAALPADTGLFGDSCAHPDQVGYEVTLAPAAPDPDGLGYLELRRSDGYLRLFSAPVDGAAFTEEVRAPGTDDDCFTLVQVDGAGNSTEASPVRCVMPSCGCGSGGAALVLFLPLLATRRALIRITGRGLFPSLS